MKERGVIFEGKGGKSVRRGRGRKVRREGGSEEKGKRRGLLLLTLIIKISLFLVSLPWQQHPRKKSDSRLIIELD